ncbi:MAG TPA: carboxypeptidase regulatory-like domain-containing protein [Terriglobales bacterium]|nr:carboxypeptidase regulatory-like domain-containing protein [Terriglobales bacterium]
MKRWLHRSLLCNLALCAPLVLAQNVTVSARVALQSGKSNHAPKAGEAILWLTPLSMGDAPKAPAPSGHPRLTQKNKSFLPHVLVVPVGSEVEFPNRDPFFHNVFSLFEGKRFDLGLYEAGSTRNVRFDKAGISYIFCNIHPEMSAVVIAVDTPYYGTSDKRGEVVIPNVPPGRYTLRMWYEAALPDKLDALTREIRVSEENSNLGLLHLDGSDLAQTHKNKYGRDYEPPTPLTSPVYEHQ